MNNKKINLLILIVSMPVGGVESQILSIVQRLNKQKYNVLICCIKDLGVLGEEAARSGIKTLVLNLMKSNRFSVAIPYRISKLLKENNIHILWTHQYVANLYGRIASLLAGTPVVISNFCALYDNPKLHRRIFNYLLSYRTDALIAVSQAVASDIKSYDHVAPGKIRVIYNGIDLSLFNIQSTRTECRRKLGLPEKDIIVGSIGRLSKEKNHKMVVEALHVLPPNVKGLVVGDGPLRKTLEEAGGKRFYFTGRMDYNLIPFALKAIDIFCFPSLWEGFGTALVEAMSAGLPVVVSDISPHREVVGDAGIFVPVNDVGRLVEELKMLIDNLSLRNTLGHKAKERAKIFSIENTVKAYDELFEETLAQKRFS
jgi:glycosyltransferase involved in cell wall biosynthesis